MPQSILEEASAITAGDRQAAYGHPLDNHELIAYGWRAILGIHVTAEKVELCMIWSKVAREIYQHKRDNLVDIAGYAWALQATIEERERRVEAVLFTPESEPTTVELTTIISDKNSIISRLEDELDAFRNIASAATLERVATQVA